MQNVNSDEAWRFIPPEEKIDIMTQAHAKGVTAVIMAMVIAATCTVALKLPWLIWAVLITSPIIFQFVSGRAWRALKPSITLRYLAARSAARRYAYSARAEDITPRLIFRGTIQLIAEKSNDEELFVSNKLVKSTDVWIALFSDTIVILSERLGGAVLELSHSIDNHLNIRRPDDAESLNNNELLIEIAERGTEKTFHLYSPYPAALLVFEKKYHEFYEILKRKDKLNTAMRSMGAQLNENGSQQDLSDNLGTI